MKQTTFDFPIPEDHEIIFRPWITKNGRILYAKMYGIKAFPILVKKSGIT